ncbi:MAG: sulfur carrier protein ThiS adenylyltransferase ThiF [Bacteroidales bacterium]|nr:sulfur carrier protein ThiS adenylyltransferase ThiF [Bacteroidales bacterium]
MTTEEIRERLADKVVGIAGCGGLGSNCAVALARTGIGKLILVDDDKLEATNLNRQYFFADQIGEYKSLALRDNIHRIDDTILVETHVIRLDPGLVTKLFADCDVIIEAFDQDNEKQMIIETVLGDMPDKSIISGQGLAGYGKNDMIGTMHSGRLYIVGDHQSEVSPTHPPLAPRVGIVANMQANLVLEILLITD